VVRALVVVVGFVCSFGAGTSAFAGRTHYGWLLGTEVMPERGAEIETWIAEQNRESLKQTTWGFQGLAGVTDQLELAFPVELLWARGAGVPGDFTFASYGIEARYRFVSQDPVDAPPFAPFIRAAIERDVRARDTVRAEIDLVGSYEMDAVHALVDLGFAGNIAQEDASFEIRPGAGVSFRVTGDLRLGAEVYGQISFDTPEQRWVAAGPNLAWSHGRFWLSAAFGIGLYQIQTAPRAVWGIAF
jgi:hypothetical protein